MRCIYCNETTAVIDKRTSQDNVTRRRRKCLKCGKRFTTNEILVDEDKKKFTIKISKPKIKKEKITKEKKIIKKPLSPEKQKLIELFAGKK